MFENDAPGEDIRVLMRWLKQTHQPEFLYRGQTRDYPVMVPSFYRHLVVDLTDPSPMAKIDPVRLDALMPQTLLRLDMLRQLVRCAGLGLGNIIAQQYGITSESLDVTESIDVAGFFATRRYPNYAQVEDGIGVIYRFDSSSDRRLDAPFRMSDLDDLFERGKSDIGFFDFFVHQRNRDRIFDRDSWFGMEEADVRLVSTISFATSWNDLKEAMEERPARRAKLAHPLEAMLADKIQAVDWAKTRFAGQSGGFLRPEIYWDAFVPKNYSVVNTRAEMAPAYGGGGLSFHARLPDDIRWPDAPGPIRALPLVIPSSAIRKTAVGVENIRSRSDCQPFFFRHGPVRATPILRRNLWPEPSEDPLYGALWHAAMRALMHQHYPNHIPPIDDPEHGLLDRGYRVVGEAATRDARNFDDLYRGQLEDVEEAIAAFGPATDLYAAKGEALVELNRPTAALGSFADGLRADRADPGLLGGLAQLLRAWGKRRWARRLVDYARSLHPNDLPLLEADASLHLDAFEFELAEEVTDQGLALTVEGSREWGRLAFYRIVIAELLHNDALSQEWREAAERFGVGYQKVDDVIRQIRASSELRRAPPLSVDEA